MTLLSPRIRSLISGLLRWYQTPAGMASLAFITFAVVLAFLGFERWALVVVVVWIGLLLPHKLNAERRDWTVALEASAKANSGELSKVNHSIDLLVGDLGSLPTIDELGEWQQSIESSQQSANQRLTDAQSALSSEMDKKLTSTAARIDEDVTSTVVSVDGLRSEFLSELATVESSISAAAKRVAELERSIVGLPDEVRSASQEARDILARDSQQARQMIERDVQAIGALYALLEPAHPLPPLGGWALRPESAAQLTQLILEQKPMLVVETGSGSSTVLAAAALAKLGRGKVIALEHDLGFARATRDLISAWGLESYAEVQNAPLTEITIGGDVFSWYDLGEGFDDTSIDVLLVDGPPGLLGPLARYPALPMLHDSLASRATVIVDDASRPDEISIVQRWQNEFQLYRSDQGKNPEFAILRLVEEDQTTPTQRTD